jgi:hypothetical protein
MTDSVPPAIDISDLSKRVDVVERRSKRHFRILLSVFCILLIVSGTAAGLGFWQLKQIKSGVENLSFSDAVNSYVRDADFVTIQIGTIQFLRRGFSISFDSAKYTQDGLVLSGTIGNATQLWINTLTLNFSVRPNAYQVREKWNKDPFIFWNTSDFEIGKAQVNVGTLIPGSTTLFTVTVPNVKQTKDEPQIVVWFSGERYSYMK